MFEKYSYDGSFQDLLLASIIAHPEKFMHNAGTLNSAYFTSVPRVATARALFAYWNKNGRFPRPEALSQIVYDAILRSSDAKEEGNIMAFVRKITTLDTSDVDYAVEKTVEFARERALYIACDKAINYHKTGEAPPGGFTKLFEEALKVGQNVKDLGYQIKSGDNDIQLVMDTVTSRSYGIQTGFGDLDRIWPFGWGPGWLIAVLAPPKRYKTAFCINLAMNMIENTGSPVFYYPCEISQELAAVRCLCNLTELPFDMIYQNKKTFTEKALQMANERLNSTLLIKGFPSRSATISGDIRAHALTASAKFGIKPKAIIIDFAETVKPSSDPKRTSEHRAQGEIYLEARALGSEFGCPVILPDRCNKETVDLAVPSMKSFQGSFEKAGIVDVAIGLCATDDEYAQNIIRYFVFLNRHGIAYQHFRGNVEPRSMTMSILEKIEWQPENDQGDERPGHRLRRRRQRPPLDRIED